MSEDLPDLWQEITEATGLTDVEMIHAIIIELLLVDIAMTGNPVSRKKYVDEMVRYGRYKTEQKARGV